MVVCQAVKHVGKGPIVFHDSISNECWCVRFRDPVVAFLTMIKLLDRIHDDKVTSRPAEMV